MRYARFAPVLLVLVAALLAIALYVVPASAETITVTRGDDPTPDGCGVDGCSLREAVAAANAAPGDQVIDVGSLEIVLESTVTITGDLTIQGAGPDDSNIRTSNGSQLFNIQANAHATFNGVWLNGSSTAGPGGCGGALYNAGDLTLEHTKVAKNFITGKGAGLCNLGTASLNDVLMSANGATGGPGGALWNAGIITITHSSFTQNTLDGDAGGAIANNENGNMTITYSTISSNTLSLDCGGCSSGGGISTDGLLTLQYSTVSNNTSDNGGGLVNRGDATIERTTFSGNMAGAINNVDGTMLVVRSTISDNVGAAYPKSGVGGISNYDTLSLVNVTIADNTNMQFQYGGLFTNTTAATDYKASIFAYNGPKNCSTSGSQVSHGNNIYAPAAAACATVGTDQAVDDAGIAALGDNGGPTLTNLPQAGSPAIDHGGAGCVAPDQRGALIADTHCDAGAVELSGTPPTPTPTASPTTAPIAFPMGDNSCSDDIGSEDLTGELKLVVEIQAPDTCGRETIPCFPFNGACYPVWDDPNCDARITPLDVLPIAAKLAGVPMTFSDCPVVGDPILHP